MTTDTEKPAKPVRIKKGRGDRPPDSVIEARVDEMMAVLSKKPNISRYALHKLFIPRWKDAKGNECNWRTVDRIESRARKEITKYSLKGRPQWLDDLLSGYLADMENDDPKVRMAARLGVRELLGLDAPKISKVENKVEFEEVIVKHANEA